MDPLERPRKSNGHLAVGLHHVGPNLGLPIGATEADVGETSTGTCIITLCTDVRMFSVSPMG